jgi:hypothetical protein
MRIDMVKVRQAEDGAKARLVSGLRGPTWKQPYLDAINGLEGDGVLEFEADEGETLRQIRVRIARAAKDLSRTLRVGETQEGTLLVWLAEAHTPMKRGRRRKADPDPANMATQATP